MISDDEALEIANRFIEEQCGSVEGGVAILESQTIKKTYGWIFFYNSKRYIESGDELEALGGNGPLVVETNGQVRQLGSVQAPAATIAQFERDIGLRCS